MVFMDVFWPCEMPPVLVMHPAGRNRKTNPCGQCVQQKELPWSRQREQSVGACRHRMGLVGDGAG